MTDHKNRLNVFGPTHPANKHSYWHYNPVLVELRVQAFSSIFAGDWFHPPPVDTGTANTGSPMDAMLRVPLLHSFHSVFSLTISNVHFTDATRHTQRGRQPACWGGTLSAESKNFCFSLIESVKARNMPAC